MDRRNDSPIEEWRLEPDVWVWCARCERAYPADRFSLYMGPDEQRVECAYDDCEGDYFYDGYNYDHIRLEKQTDWPDVPERGVKYKLVGQFQRTTTTGF
jgi:hypothetical protein